MKYILSHTAAVIWYMRHEFPRIRGERTSRASVVGASAPDASSVARLQWFLRLEGVKLDFLVDDSSKRRHLKNLNTHVCTESLPEGSLVSIPSCWDEIPLYVVSPELAYLQVACGSTLQTAVYTGMALCSDYRIDVLANGGVVRRVSSDRRPASVASIGRFLDRAQGMKGVRPARRALRYVVEHAWSPKESGLAMFYGLPCHYGGMHIGTVTLNPCVEVYAGRDMFGEAKTETRYPDIVISAAHKGIRYDVAFDYDADSTHEGGDKAVKDRRRANAIATVRNLVHFTLVTSDISDFNYLVLMGERARRVLKQRRKPSLNVPRDSVEGRRVLSEYRERQLELFNSFVMGVRDF